MAPELVNSLCVQKPEESAALAVTGAPKLEVVLRADDKKGRSAVLFEGVPIAAHLTAWNWPRVLCCVRFLSFLPLPD